MTVCGLTAGSRPVSFRAPLVRPQIGVISDPAYVVGMATIGMGRSSATALPRPVAEPPPTVTTVSASPSRASLLAASASAIGTCGRTSEIVPTMRSPSRAPSWCAHCRPERSAMSMIRCPPRRSISSGTRAKAPSPNTTRPGRALYVNDAIVIGRSSSAREPRITSGVLARVVRVEVDEAALDLGVADLEDVAPAPRAMLRLAGLPWPVAVLADARPLDGECVCSGHDVIERWVVVEDRFERPAYIAEHPTDLVATFRDAPLREVDLGVHGEQLEDAAAGFGDASVVEGLEVLERNCHSLRVCHRLGDRHVSPPS